MSSPTVLRPESARAHAMRPPDAMPAELAECPTCGAPIATPHCAQCGEGRPAPGRLALRHLLSEAVEHIVSFDGTFVRTLVTLVRRPGALTEAYLRGSRVRYTRPVQLFLVINVAFFVAAPKLGLLRYGTPVPDHPTTAVEQARIDSTLSESMTGRHMLRRMRDEHERWDQMVVRYNAAVESRTSAFIGLRFIPGLVTLALVYAGRGKYVAGHAVFMLHFAAFALLWEPVAALPLELASRTLKHAPGPAFGSLFLATLFLPELAYLALALKRVYAGTWTAAVARAAAITFALISGLSAFAWVIHTIGAWSV